MIYYIGWNKTIKPQQLQLGPVYMEMEGPQVGEVTGLGRVTLLSI